MPKVAAITGVGAGVGRATADECARHGFDAAVEALADRAEAAIRGFTDSLRGEISHDKLDVHLTMVARPAVNTPQFDWTLNQMGRKAKPVASIFEPEVPAHAIPFAAKHRRRDIWASWPTVKAIPANRIASGLIDRYLAKTGY